MAEKKRREEDAYAALYDAGEAPQYASRYQSQIDALAGAMLAGRVIAGAARALIFAKGTYTMAAWIASFFVNAVPGIILHLLLIPAVIYALQKARLIPERF